MSANDPLENHLRETAWRRKLAPAEEEELRAWLAAHPEARAAWEAELGLNEFLAGVPDAPVPSNFTARVLRAVEAGEAADARRHDSRTLWRLFLPKAAVVAVVVTAGLLGYRGHQSRQRAEMVRSVAAISSVASAPAPDILEDFEAIRRLPATGYDQEILDLMQP